MVEAVDRDRSCRSTVDAAARTRDRQRRVRPDRVFHCQDLHLDDACWVGGIADLEDECALIAVDPEVPVPLAVEGGCIAVDAES